MQDNIRLNQWWNRVERRWIWL